MYLEKIRKEKGVTLVALVIIIVILIILAGVTINVTMGEGGLIKHAQYAAEQTANSTIAEQEQLNKLTGELANITAGGEVDPPDIIPDYTITIGEPQWLGDGTASVTVSTTEEGYTLQYQINGTDEGSWQTVEGGKVEGLHNGDTINTRITDGEHSSSVQGKLIQDKVAPDNATIQLNTESLTVGESLTATVTHTDNQSGVEITKSKWIMNTSSGNIGTNEGSYTGTFTSNGETITLDSSRTGTYYLHVLTVDKAGNKTETISNKIMIGGIIGSITQKGETVWSDGKATVELETAESDYDIEYKVNDGDWEVYNGPIGNLNHGDKITARLTNGVTVGDEVVIDVKDEKGPVVAVTGGGVTTDSVTVSVVADDMETGMADTVTYTYYIKKSIEEDTAYEAKATDITDKSYTFTGLEDGTSYDVKVEVKSDKAGNTGIGTVQNQITESVPGAGGDLETGNIVASKPEWSNGKASITLTTAVAKMQIQYQVGEFSEGSWLTIPSGGKVENLVHGDTVYARLTDGTNYGDYASVTILDGEVPEKANIELSTDNIVVGGNLTATVTHTDNQSGVEITQSKWVMNTNSGEIGTEPTSYTETFSSNGETITLNSSKTGEYYLHVLTIDKAGNKTETVSNKITIKGVEGSITQKGDTVWSDGKASVELEAGETEFYIEYKVNEGEWTRYEGPIGDLNHGDKITARLTNGTTAGEEVVINVTDDKKPVVTVTPGGTTTNSVTVSASAVDNESGIAEEVTYTYYIKQSTEPDTAYQEKAKGVKENSYTFTGLTQGVSYDVKVEVTGDKAGNVGTGTLANQTTGKVPGGEEGVEQGAITFGGVTWSEGKASITISTNTQMQIQYQVNTVEEEQWKEIDNGGTVDNLEHGDTVYASLTDGTNYGDYASVSILDDKVPEKATIELNTENLVAGEDLTATVTHTDNQSGVEITQSKWVMNTTAEEIGTDEVSYSETFTTNGETITLDSSQTGEYYLHVLTIDKAGNKVETISNKITIDQITGTVNQKGTTTWSEGTASVELEATESKYTIEYKINEGEWQDYTGTAITGLNHGDKITARLTNKKATGPETVIEVKDETNPTVLVTSGGTTTNSVVVNVVASDNESGMAEEVAYTYYIKQTSQGEENYTAPENAQNITETTYTFTGLTQGTSYDVKVEATGDKAGNVGTGTLANQQTSTIGGPSEGLEEGNIVASSPVWSGGKASIILITSVEGMQIQYQVGGISGQWTTISSGEKVENLLHGNTVYARLTDGTNHGDYASVTILDGIKPTVSVSTGTITDKSIQVNVTANDGQSGLATSGTYKYYINDSLEATTETNTYTFSGLSEETQYSIKVEVIDKANNIGIATTNSKTLIKSYVGYYADIDGNGTVDGVIYADLAKGNTGSGELKDFRGKYSIPVVSNLKKYKTSQKNYNGKFGTKDVISPVGGEDYKNNRFYVMALEDIDNKGHMWYYSAYRKLDIDLPEEFGTGKQNTQTMIKHWKNNKYPPQNDNDMWGLSKLQAEVNKGWFVPSSREWAAFGGELGLTDESWETLELYYGYWSSSSRSSDWCGYIIIDQTLRISASPVTYDSYHVRLSTTF